MLVERTYSCGYCGEEIVVEIDISAGSQQEYVEDCPVCCHPHVLRVTVESDGHVTLNCETE
jgi:transcription elongation factor Elf1